MGDCAQIVPARIGIGGELCRLNRVELLRGLDEIAFAHDVVALEHRTRLVAGHLHGHTFGNAGAHEVADCCASGIVRNASGTAGLLARLPPGFRESNDRLALHLLACPMKHPRTQHAISSQAVVLRLLRLQELL